MEPDKFEKHIKDKLNERELKPSKDAWNKLEHRLDEQEQRGAYKSFWWIGIAASVVGVLLVISQFLNGNPVEESAPQVVDAPEIESVEDKQNDLPVEAAVVIDEDEKSLKIAHSKSETIKHKTQETKIIAANRDEIPQENLNSELKEEASTPVAIASEALTFEEKTIQHVVAKIKVLKEQDNKVTDEAIDALLLAAQKEITLNKLYNEKTKVVDANALLQDVEAELDQSFRIKVFETLKSSYGKVKTAVAQRND